MCPCDRSPTVAALAIEDALAETVLRCVQCARCGQKGAKITKFSGKIK